MMMMTVKQCARNWRRRMIWNSLVDDMRNVHSIIVMKLNVQTENKTKAKEAVRVSVDFVFDVVLS